MKALIFGASGMIGKGVLLECLDHPDVDSVLCIGRSKIDQEHSKLRQFVHQDFTDFKPIIQQLKDVDACYFCLGVSAGGMSEEDYTRITYDFTLAAAKTLFEANPNMTFIYVSGQGTDSTEKGRMMWARVKGRVENDLLKLGFKQAFMFRPGMILPLRGIESRTPSYRFVYRYFTWLLKVIEKISPNSVTDTTRIGTAMINAHLKGYDKAILTPKNINELAG